MKVLFIAKGDLPDYQSDMIFHGGRMLLGDNLVDCNKLWYMYKNEKELYWNQRIPENGKAYGRGFTMCGRLVEDNIDRTNITNKIKNHFFDKIVYGSCTRCLDYFDLVKQYYNKNDVVLIDGEDDQNIREHLLPYGVYYKRELSTPDIDKANPLYFAIPEEIILNHTPEKTREYATIIPGDLSTYTYDNEEDYYNGYRESYFGVTYKKGGWDCLRHYEIMMNGCMPYFPGLENCPPRTMASFPKNIVLQSNQLLEKNGLPDNYKEMVSELLDFTRTHLTTKKIAQYVLNT